ncbi:hypothetical protein LTR27_000110 [Elasticomyces elasticus]|nr:hypothetical protein LTR27_000110 [Elasticomyces elasticus]
MAALSVMGITAAPAPARLVARASTGCADGEVAVGSSQLCNGGSSTGGSANCGQLGGELYTNDCSVFAGTTSYDSSGWCDGESTHFLHILGKVLT